VFGASVISHFPECIRNVSVSLWVMELQRKIISEISQSYGKPLLCYSILDEPIDYNDRLTAFDPGQPG